MRLLRRAALSSLIVLYVACQVNARAMISAETKLDLYMIANMSFAEAGNVYTNPQACGVYTIRVYPSNARLMTG
ncbi:hypothetical protein C8Q76DRAFT_744773 [Earliella scabrosa]|nr:hypothetical protein C8Q76DRAFT_744773 [Earliella scabrosa]